jgi:hypothetical protein
MLLDCSLRTGLVPERLEGSFFVFEYIEDEIESDDIKELPDSPTRFQQGEFRVSPMHGRHTSHEPPQSTTIHVGQVRHVQNEPTLALFQQTSKGLTKGIRLDSVSPPPPAQIQHGNTTGLAFAY